MSEIVLKQIKRLLDSLYKLFPFISNIINKSHANEFLIRALFTNMLVLDSSYQYVSNKNMKEVVQNQINCDDNINQIESIISAPKKSCGIFFKILYVDEKIVYPYASKILSPHIMVLLDTIFPKYIGYNILEYIVSPIKNVMKNFTEPMKILEMYQTTCPFKQFIIEFYAYIYNKYNDNLTKIVGKRNSLSIDEITDQMCDMDNERYTLYYDDIIDTFGEITELISFPYEIILLKINRTLTKKLISYNEHIKKCIS